MPGIETWGVLTINYETIGKQLTSDDDSYKRKRNFKHERAIQTEGGKPESCTNKRDVQKQCNADNAARPGVVPNPTVMDNNNNKKKSSFSDVIINENQSFLSD